MNQNIKIYKENYENLPGRFIEKIGSAWMIGNTYLDIAENDLQYLETLKSF